MDDGCVKALPDLFPQCVPQKYFFHNFHIFKTLLSYLVFLYQPIPIITSPIIITTVQRMESGESKQDTIIPVPTPVKNSMIDFSFFIFPNTLSLSIVFTIFEYSIIIVSRVF